LFFKTQVCDQGFRLAVLVNGRTLNQKFNISCLTQKIHVKAATIYIIFMKCGLANFFAMMFICFFESKIKEQSASAMASALLF